MPANFRDIRRALDRLGGSVEESGGKHNYKARMPGKRIYPIPAHRGWQTEVPDCFVNGLCRNFGIDKNEFWRILRGR